MWAAGIKEILNEHFVLFWAASSISMNARETVNFDEQSSTLIALQKHICSSKYTFSVMFITARGNGMFHEYKLRETNLAARNLSAQYLL